MIVSKYLRLVDMLAVMFVCKTFNEIVYQNKRFCEHLNLSDQIICKKYVGEIFFSNFIKSVFRVYSIVNQDVIVNSFLRYRTGNLRRVVSNAGILAYLLSCSRFGKSKVGFLCRYCFLAWVGEAKYFCESVSYYFRSTCSKRCSNDVKKLFDVSKKYSVTLTCICDYESYPNIENIDRCMYLLTARNSVKIIECYLEVMMSLIIRHVVDISNDLECLYSCHGVAPDNVSKLKNLYLTGIVKNMKIFYTECCSCLKPDTFVYMYSSFRPYVNYPFDNFKIVKKDCLEDIEKKFKS